MAKKLKVQTINYKAPKGADRPGYKWHLTPDIISCDIGNGNSTVVHMNENRKLRMATIPTGRVPVTGSTLNKSMAGMAVADFIWAEIPDKITGGVRRYGVGDGVWDATTEPYSAFVADEARYGGEEYIFMLLVLLCAINAPQATPLSLVVSAPPSYINNVGSRIVNALKKGENNDDSGEWTIRMGYDKTPRLFKIARVKIIPEGTGAYNAYAFNVNGENTFIPSKDGAIEDIMCQNLSIQDAGFGTYDAYTVTNGEIITDGIALATDRNAGVKGQMVRRIRQQLIKAFGDGSMPELPDAKIDFWLKEWVSHHREKAIMPVVFGGKRLDLHRVFERAALDYANYIQEQKISEAWVNTSDVLLLAGGGWEYILPYILQLNEPSRNILYPSIVPHMKNIHFSKLNAVGGLHLMAAFLSSRDLS